MGAVVAFVGVGIGLALAFWPTSAQAAPKPEEKPEHEPTKPPDPPPEKRIVPPKDGGVGALLGAGALLGPGTAGVLGGGMAAAAVGAAAVAATVGAGAAIGAGITGDALGAVGGAVGTVQQMFAVGGGFTFISGQAGNIGRVLGREIDRVLNGTGLPGVSGSRVAIEVAGFAAGLATVSTAITMIPFIGQTFVLVVVLATAVQDAERVRYGQGGLVTDATAEAAAFERNTIELITRRVLEALSLPVGQDWSKALGPEDNARVQAIAIAQAIGFAEEMNATRERAWLSRPRGVGVTEPGHRAWAEARGIYLVPANLEEVRRRLRNLLEGRDPRDLMTLQEWDEHRARGAKVANLKNYLQAMAEPFDAFASADAHAAKWNRAGAFTGATDLNGNLVDGFVLVDWRKSQVQKSVVVVDNTPANSGPMPPPIPGAPAVPGNLGTSNLTPPGNFTPPNASTPPAPPGNFAAPPPAAPAPVAVTGTTANKRLPTNTATVNKLLKGI